MPLDLNDVQAIDYSSNLPFLPFEALGSYVFALLSYDHLPDAYNGECDLLTVEVRESTNADVRPGSRFAFVFKTNVVGKAKPFAAARLRSFVRAAVGVPESSARTFDANAARASLLEEDLSGGENLVRMTRREKPGKGENADRGFADDRWEAYR